MIIWTVLVLSYSVTTSYADYWSCDGGEDDLLQQEGRPFVWIDHSSNCNPPSRLTCSAFGLDFICTRTSGCDSEAGCTTTVLCAAEQKHDPTEPTPTNNLQVVAYNIYELDYVYDVDLAKLSISFYQYTGQRERTCRIPYEILRDHAQADVIVFEELFMGGCFPAELDLRDLLTYYGFRFITPNVGIEEAEGPNPLIYENGGVIVASRWPIVYYEDYVFSNSDPTTADAYSSKGVMYAHIIKSDSTRIASYHVFGTHMQSMVGELREAVREAQATEIFDFIEGLRIPSTEAVIIAGDFNADLNNFKEHSVRVLENMGAILPEIVGPMRTTWDPLTNELIIDKDEPNEQWLDYVVLSSSHLAGADVRANLIAFKPQNPTFTVCINATTGNYVSPRSSDCKGNLDVMNLSDHYAVAGSFVFTENTEKRRKKKKCCKNWRFQKEHTGN